MARSRPVGAFSFVDDAVTLALGDDTPDMIPARMNVWRNGRIGSGPYQSRSGINVYDTQDFKSPSSLSVDDLLQWLRERTPASYAINLLYYNGDHWQRGRGWSGPMPPRDDPTYSIVLKQVQKAFRSKNAIKEVVRRHVMAAVGKEPIWYYINRDKAATATPTVSKIRRERRALSEVAPPPADNTGTSAASNALMQIEQDVTRWWNKRKIVEIMQEESATVLLAGRAMLRMFVPAGAVDDEGNLLQAPASFAEALEYIFVHEVPIAHGTVVADTTTMQELGVYAYRKPNGSVYGELAYLQGFGDNAATIVATVSEQPARSGAPATVVQSSAIYNLGGRLPMYEITRDTMITQQVREQQAAINEACTMARVNGQVAGFLERTVLNGQVPGYYKKDTDGKMKFVRTEYQTGAGAINFVAGIPQYGDDGSFKGLTTPSIVYRAPTDPDAFDKTKIMAYRDLLDETDQTHHLMASDQYVSGEGRKQARANFITSLRPTRTRLNEQGSWLLETLYALAYDLCPEEVRAAEGLPDPAEVSVVFATQLDAGPATTEEIRSAIESRTAKLISRQTTQSIIGVEDTDAESALIAEEEAAGVPWPGSGPAGQIENGGRTAGSISNDRLGKDKVIPAKEAQT